MNESQPSEPPGKGSVIPAWRHEPERGSLLALRLIAWIAAHLGRRVTWPLLYPITLYFVAVSPRSRAASRGYLTRVLGRPARWRDVFRHHFCFAVTLLDRVFISRHGTDALEVRVHGEAVVAKLLDERRGAFLLGAHMGSFDLLRALEQRVPDLHVKLLMYEGQSRNLNAVLRALNPRSSMSVIGLGQIDSMLRMSDALEQGEFVGMLGDRLLEDSQQLHAAFLGSAAPFPTAPYRVAALLKRPIVLMFALYRGGRRYDIFFEELVDFSGADRRARAQAIEQGTRRYIARLEYYCRLAPYNWFNFFAFWDEEHPADALAARAGA